MIWIKKIQWLYKPTFTSLGGTILYFSFAHLPFALPCRKPWQGQVFLLTVQGCPSCQNPKGCRCTMCGHVKPGLVDYYGVCQDDSGPQRAPSEIRKVGFDLTWFFLTYDHSILTCCLTPYMIYFLTFRLTYILTCYLAFYVLEIYYLEIQTPNYWEFWWVTLFHLI